YNLGLIRITGSVDRMEPTGIFNRLGDSGRLQPVDADPQRVKLASPLTAEAFHSVKGDSGAAHLGDGLARRRGSYRHDDARSAGGHLPRGGSGGQEFGPHCGGYRARNGFEWHLELPTGMDCSINDRV